MPRPATVVTVSLSEFGDFAMMRKMLLGIKRRAERYPAPSGAPYLGLPETAVPAGCPDAADPPRGRPPGDGLRINTEESRHLAWRK